MRITYFKSAFAASFTVKCALYLVISLLTMACSAEKPLPLAFIPTKTLTATGYGTAEKSDLYSRSQIKLMAMRASKMDAYRSLAEQLNGLQLRGQTTVENMEVTRDSYQVYINAYLRGARVKRTSAIGTDLYAGDDMFETVVELDLTARFYDCINGTSALLTQCLQHTQASDFNPELSTVSSIDNTACNAVDCYNYPSTHGFNRK